MGYASDTDNFTGYVDNVTIGLSGVNTTYDFDPSQCRSRSQSFSYSPCVWALVP